MEIKKENTRRKWIKKRFYLKSILMLEILICYMAVLTMVSYWRGPVKYQAIMDFPLLRTSDFMVDNGEMRDTSDVLFMQNKNAGSAVGYYAYLNLQGLESIYVQFIVDCPEEYAGNVLHVDLLGENYDNDEQEYQLRLGSGINEVAFFLDPGKNPPSDVVLRFFTLDLAGYSVENLQIYAGKALPKVSMGMLCMVIAVFVLCGITIAMFFMKNKAE